jgi:hypothetical protein
MYWQIIKLNHVNVLHVSVDKDMLVLNIIIHVIDVEIHRYINTSKYKNKLILSIENLYFRSTPCPHVKQSDEWIDPTVCEAGDNCKYCHTRTEQQFHPEVDFNSFFF